MFLENGLYKTKRQGIKQQKISKKNKPRGSNGEPLTNYQSTLNIDLLPNKEFAMISNGR